MIRTAKGGRQRGRREFLIHLRGQNRGGLPLASRAGRSLQANRVPSMPSDAHGRLIVLMLPELLDQAVEALTITNVQE